MNTSTNKIPELLCPAGDLTRLKAAVDYGADAVYLAGDDFTGDEFGSFCGVVHGNGRVELHNFVSKTNVEHECVPPV